MCKVKNAGIVTQILFSLSLSLSYGQTNVGTCLNRDILKDSAYFKGVISPIVSYFLDGSGIEYFKNDTLEIAWYQNGKCKYERHYKYGQVSLVKTWWENGLVQTLYLTNELWNDRRVYGSTDDRIIYAALENGKIMVENGNGLYNLWGEKGLCRDTLRVGVWNKEFYDGSLTKITYKNGIRHGVYERLNKEKNVVFRCYYKNGKDYGYWKSWYNNGQKHEKGKVKNGVPLILSFWTPNGKKAIRRGRGIYCYYDDNGQTNSYSKLIEYRNGMARQ